MAIQSKKWAISHCHRETQSAFAEEMGISSIIAQLLINRGIREVEDARMFLSLDITKLHDPFLMKDMDKAVGRIRKAQEGNEKVMIFGDYDVDGVTSIALLCQALRKLGINVVTHIPHRMQDGYGLNEGIAQEAAALGVKLLITVDCGITSILEVDQINQAGIDVIIVDHHEPCQEGLPDAVAVVDPKRKDCPYPFKYLAAVGIVGKFIQALFDEIPLAALDLIALGTIADVVPLIGENRIFVHEGLPRMKDTENFGLRALLKVARIDGKKLRPYHAGFILGPRINASGRMSSAKTSLDLLLAEDETEADRLANELNAINGERQKLQKDVIQEAVKLVEQEIDLENEKIIVVSKEGWHKGVLGIVASRLAETYYRPSIVISLEKGVGTASARSVDGFHLHNALSHCSESLDNFGGHKLAAGLSIQADKIQFFREQINDFASGVLTINELEPTLLIDMEVPLSDIDLALSQRIEMLEPFGEGNPTPIFCSRGLTVKSRAMILGRETLKFWVTDGEISLPAVGFGMAKYQEFISIGKKVDLAYEVIIDDWNKAPTSQLKLRDIKPSVRDVV